ncbi:MAG: tyrosine-protein phosphatase [Acidimicrobiia bacterium]
MGVDPRHVEFEACFNFRDLGGYETVDGRTVAWGHVYRSDMFHRMTEADRGRLHELGLRTVVDLRSTAELGRYGRFDHHEVDFHHHPLFEEETTRLPPLPGLDDPEPADPAGAYLLIAEEGAAAMAAAVRVLAERDHPAVFHCAAGKDRTGMLAALLLTALGVPEDVVVADYQLTDLALPRQVDWFDRFEPDTAEELRRRPAWLLASPAHVMRAFLDGLRQRHGSPLGYLTDAGLDDDVLGGLRARLLA